MKKIKILFNQLYEFALKNDICNKDYSTFVEITQYKDRNPNKHTRTKFTKEEVAKVWTMKDYKYYEIGACNIYDAQKVADAWYYEHLQDEDASQLAEYKAIKEALENFEELGLIGGIIYVNDSPCAMTIASKINENTVDVHFEKAVGEYALNGGYAAINKLFSEKLDGVTWLNREEDIGIEGLRKAKLSYRPKIMLKKYSAVEK